MVSWRERWFGVRKTEGPWTPSLVLTAEEHEEFERRRAGRTCYYVDDKGWPIPDEQTLA